MPNIIRTGGGDVTHVNPYTQLVNYLMLYDAGNECNAITGGWSNIGGTLTKNATNMTLYTSTASWAGVSCLTINAINLTDYTKASVRWGITTIGANYSNKYCFTAARAADPTAAVEISHVNYDNPLSGDALESVDISNYNQSLYCAIVAATTSNNSTTVKLYDTWLEKQDNWQALRDHCGLSSATYTTEASLLGATPIAVILGSLDNVDYMIANCTGTFMGLFIKSTTAKTALTNSSYSSAVYANEHWAKFLGKVA